jgi:hypothetical protein
MMVEDGDDDDDDEYDDDDFAAADDDGDEHTGYSTLTPTNQFLVTGSNFMITDQSGIRTNNFSVTSPPHPPRPTV